MVRCLEPPEPSGRPVASQRSPRVYVEDGGHAAILLDPQAVCLSSCRPWPKRWILDYGTGISRRPPVRERSHQPFLCSGRTSSQVVELGVPTAPLRFAPPAVEGGGRMAMGTNGRLLRWLRARKHSGSAGRTRWPSTSAIQDLNPSTARTTAQPEGCRGLGPSSSDQQVSASILTGLREGGDNGMMGGLLMGKSVPSARGRPYGTAHSRDIPTDVLDSRLWAGPVHKLGRDSRIRVARDS